MEENRERLTNTDDLEVNEKLKQFVFDVEDNAYVLQKLAHIDYFMKDKEEREGMKTYKSINVLIGSITSSALLAVVLSPLDLVCYRYKFSKSHLNIKP